MAQIRITLCDVTPKSRIVYDCAMCVKCNTTFDNISVIWWWSVYSHRKRGSISQMTTKRHITELRTKNEKTHNRTTQKR
jgi:hypothetical protein